MVDYGVAWNCPECGATCLHARSLHTPDLCARTKAEAAADPEAEWWDEYATKLMPPVEIEYDLDEHWRLWAMALARDAWNARDAEVDRLRAVANAARAFSVMAWAGGPAVVYNEAHDALDVALAALGDIALDR